MTWMLINSLIISSIENLVVYLWQLKHRLCGQGFKNKDITQINGILGLLIVSRKYIRMRVSVVFIGVVPPTCWGQPQLLWSHSPVLKWFIDFLSLCILKHCEVEAHLNNQRSSCRVPPSKNWQIHEFVLSYELWYFLIRATF